MPQVGEQYLHYELLDFLGQGAMGQVFRAKDTRLDREVALKFLLNTNAVNADDKARFVQEAKAVARLDHPHVGVLYALEQTPEQMFLSMAYYKGQSLAATLQEGLELQTALGIFKDMLTGFQYAHERGIIHRDIKPANIFITQEGNVKILDFGLARMPDSNITQAGQIMGTLSYLAPEQIKGEVADVKSDLWSLGVLLFQMLTGELPFEGKFPRIFSLILKEDPRPLSQWLDHPDLQAIIERCLAKDKHERFAGCGELRAAIEGVELSQRLIAIRPTQASSSPNLTHETPVLAEQSTIYEPKRVVGAVLTLRAFEGRQDKLAELRQSIQDNRLVQVCGPVGRGKTALVTQFMNEDSDFGSIVFVTLRGQDPLVFESIVSLLLRTLPADKRQHLRTLQKDEADLVKALSTLLRICIAEHKTLVVIDNLEDALEDGVFTEAYVALRAFVAGVLQLHGHACQLLMTSREPLDITSLGRDLGGMFDSVEVSLEDGLSIPEGIALLQQLGDGKSGLQSAAGEVLTQVVEQCEGIPLVLNNVAGVLKRGRTMTLQRFLKTPDKLAALRLEPAKTLYDSLTADEQAVMRVLSVFGKAVPERAVHFMLPKQDTEVILLQLETTYAVQFNDEGDTYTYALRPIDQEYAYEQLAEDERQDWHSKAAAFYRDLRTPQESWRKLKDVQPQLDEFEQLVRAEAYDEACRVLTSIDVNYLMVWGHSGLARDLHLQLRDRIFDKTLQSVNFGNLGNAYSDLGEIHRAIEYYEQALAIAREIHDQRNESNWLGNLGLAYRNLGETQRAVEYFEQALKISRETHNRRDEGIHLGNLGSAYHMLGEVHRAIEYYEQALHISREINDRRGEGADLGCLGIAYRNLGDNRRAIEYYEQALAISHETNDRMSEGIWLGNLGNAYRDLGEIQSAIEYYKQALVISCEINDRRGEGIRLGNLGLVYQDLGEMQKMLACWIASLSIFDEIQVPVLKEVNNALSKLRREHTNVYALVRSLFPDGDTILNEATGQNYTFFRDAPADMPERILALIDQYAQDTDE